MPFPRTETLYLLALLLMLVVVVVTLLRPTARTAPLVWYASSTGSGSSCAETAPCTIQTWLSDAGKRVPGATLVLEDGTYTGASGRVDIPDAWLGTAAQPITIRARNDGRVLLNGQGARPVNLRGGYGVLEGVNITEGDNHAVRFHDTSHHWTLRRAVVWETNQGDAVVNLSGSFNLVEDVGVWGSGRKMLAAGAAGGASEGNVIRRVWLQWETNEHPTSNPTNAFEVGYGQDAVTAENVLATRNLRPGGRQTEPEGIVQLFATQRSRILGSIFYVTPAAHVPVGAVLKAFNDGGSHAQQGDYHPTRDTVVRQVVSVIAPGNPAHGGSSGCSFTEASGGSPAGGQNTLDRLVCVGGQPPTFTTPTWGTPTHVQQGLTLADAIGEGKSVWLDSVAAPGICRRYHNGTLTDTPLFPFPIAERVKAVSGVDIHADIESVLGPIPSVCKGGSAPIPPDPTPPPLTSLQCTGQITQVPGAIQMHCVPVSRQR